MEQKKNYNENNSEVYYKVRNVKAPHIYVYTNNVYCEDRSAWALRTEWEKRKIRQKSSCLMLAVPGPLASSPFGVRQPEIERKLQENILRRDRDGTYEEDGREEQRDALRM
jgi:hypothetical protein